MMPQEILLLSHPGDIHSVAVAEGLASKGAPAVQWYTTDFPTRSSESISFRNNEVSLSIKGPELSIDDGAFLSIWHRRPRTQPADGILHPADRLFARQHCETFRRSLLRLLGPQAFWVNSPAASELASQKILQHHLALSCQLEMPETLYANDPEDIRHFIKSQGGRVIFKVLTGAPWRDSRTRWVSYAAVIDADQLVEDEILRQTPSIFQAIVPKAHELRVTIMGRQIFTAVVRSQETIEGKIDWRRSYRELTMEPGGLPEGVQESCFQLMERLGIVFGCFDFIVTPDGRHVFLEVNEMGQFLFVEEYTKLPLLDAFCDFLIAADPLFQYQWGPNPIRFTELTPRLTERSRRAAELHVLAEFPAYEEGGPDDALS